MSEVSIGEVADQIIDPAAAEAAMLDDGIVATDAQGAFPPWVMMPMDLVVPPGVPVTVMEFTAEMMRRPTGSKSVQMLFWPITVKEEYLAHKRARGGGEYETIDELCKLALRAIDGVKVDWTKGAAPINQFWMNLPIQCVKQIRNWFAQVHMMDQEHQIDFFANHFVVRTAVGG